MGVVTQARTGHGYFGEYYQIHNIREPIDCPCGAELQTREHIPFECDIHEEPWHIIDDGAPDHKLATVLGTKTGIDALAKFVRGSKRRSKNRKPEASRGNHLMRNKEPVGLGTIEAHSPTTLIPDLPLPKQCYHSEYK